jgi:hypothetical protein
LRALGVAGAEMKRKFAAMALPAQFNGDLSVFRYIVVFGKEA